ncbi:hypothetical protein KCP71_05960 [Salmonella enterica subsp. enterica]|nr:hypothetical protein KCP71_05960 [Salmonella enterica subsp. enterica]
MNGSTDGVEEAKRVWRVAKQKYCILHHDDACRFEDTLVHLGLSIRASQRLLKCW